MSRLVEQIRQAIAAFDGCKTTPALIGGLALAAHQVVRATRDVDFLIDADDANRVHATLLDLGYHCAHRTEDAANYLREDEGLDVLYAHGPIARRLLAEASVRSTTMGTVRVVSAEGLIGFKLQALINNPDRIRDLDDIRALLHAQEDRLDMDEMRDISSCSIAPSCSMNCWPTRMPTNADSLLMPVAGGEVAVSRLPEKGDLSDWVDLMEAVDALCPVWPQRDARRESETYLL